MKINYRYKKVVLEQIYRKLEMIKKNETELDVPLTIIKSKEGIAFTDKKQMSNITIVFKIDDSMSEVRVIKNGVKLLYPVRKVRIKKTNVEEILKIFRTDERLNGCYNTLETFFAVVLNVKEGKGICSRKSYYAG